MNKKLLFAAGLVLSVLMMAACSTAAAEVVEESAPAEAAAEGGLALTGSAEMTWTVADLEAMPQVDADYTNKDGETNTFSGVAFSELFTAAGVSDYTTVTLVANDGYSAEVTADEMAACANCLVAVDDDGSLRSVMPDMASKVQVKGLVEIQVQ